MDNLKDNIILPEFISDPIKKDKKRKKNIIPNTNYIDFSNINQINDLGIIKDVTYNKLSGAYLMPDLKELTRLTNSNYVTNDENSYRLATNQTLTEMLGNYLPKAAYTFASGFVSNFNYDFGSMIDMWNGVEKDYSNIIFNKANELREKAEEYPIYQNNSSFSDPAYWLNQVSNATFSFGLAAGTFLEQGILTGLTATTGGATSVLQGSELLNSFSKIKNFISNPVTKTLTFGTVKGIQEGFINGYETAQSVKKEFLDRGYSEEDALKYASEAASLAYKMEVGPLILLNALQLSTLKKVTPFSPNQNLNLGYSGAVESLLTNSFNIKNKTIRKATDLLFNTGSEGVEEAYQGGVSDYAKHTVLSKNNLTSFNDFEFFTPKRVDEVVGGIIGGAGFHIIGKGLSALHSSPEEKEDTKQIGLEHEKFIQSTKNLVEKNLNLIKEANKEGDNRKEEYARFIANKDNIFQSLVLDYQTKKETAFESYLSSLNEIKEAAVNNDLETLKKYNIDDTKDIEYIVKNYDNYISDAQTAKSLFIKNFEKVKNAKIAFRISDSELVVNHIDKKLNNNKSTIDKILQDNSIYNLLTGKAQEKYKLIAEKLAIDTLIKVSPELENSAITERKSEIEKLISEISISNKENSIIENLEKKDIILHHLNNIQLEQVKDIAVQNILKYSNEDYIKIERQEQANLAIEKSESKEKLKSIKNKLIAENLLNPELISKLEEKEKEITFLELKSEEEKEKQLVSNSRERFFKEINLEQYNNTNLKDNELLYEEKDESEILSRISVPSNTVLSKNLIDSFKNYINSAKLESFEDLIKDIINTKDIIKAESMFDLLAHIYSNVNSNKLDKKYLDEIYNKYFNTRDIFLKEFEILQNSLNSDVTLEEVKNIEKLKNKDSEEDIYTDNSDNKISKGVIKFAFSFEDIKKDSETGKYIKLSNNLKDFKENDLMSNHFILDPDFIYKISLENKEKEVVVIQQFDNNEINMGDGTTWGELKENSKNKVKNGEWNQSDYDNWFIQKVPVVVVYKGELVESPTIIASVHSPYWYSEKNISNRLGTEIQKQEIDRGLKDTFDLRVKLSNNKISNKINSLPIQLDFEQEINWVKTTVFDNVPKSISELSPESTLAVVTSVTSNGFDIELPYGSKLNKNNIIKFDNLSVGKIVDIRRLGVNSKGEFTYIMLPIMNDSPISKGNLSKDLNIDIYNTIKYGILSATLLNNRNNVELLKKLENKYNITIGKAVNIRNSILRDFGYDIEKNELPKFINVFNNVRVSKSNYLEGIVYINSNENNNHKTYGSISFSKKNGEQITVGNKYEGDISKLLSNLDMLFGSINLLNNILINYNIKESRNENISLFTHSGEIYPNKRSYQEIMKSVFKTIFVSYKIKTTDNKDKWIFNIQPTIKFNIKDESEIKEVVEEENLIDNNVKTNDEVQNIIDKIKNSTLSEEEILIALNQIKKYSNDELESRLNFNQERLAILSETLSDIQYISLQEKNQIISYIIHNFLQKLNLIENYDISNTDTLLNNIFDEIIKSKIDNFNNLLNFFTALDNKELIDENTLNLTKLNSILENREKVLIILRRSIDTFLKTKTDDIRENENYDNAVEKNIKIKFNTRLKSFFYGFEKKSNKTNTVLTNNLGFTLYEDPDYIYNLLLDITTIIPSNWNLLIKTLKNKYQTNIGEKDTIVGKELFSKIANKLDGLPEDLKNQILFRTHLNRNTYLKPLLSSLKNNIDNNLQYLDEEGAEQSDNSIIWDITILNENEDKTIQKIKNSFILNFHNYTDIYLKKDNKAVNTVYVNNIIEQIDNFRKNYNNLSEKEKIQYLKKILDSIGLNDISLNTIEVTIKEQEYLDNKNTLFGNIGLLFLIKKEILIPLLNDKDNVNLNDISTPLNYLINKEIELNGTFTPSSVYVNGVTLQGVSANTLIYDIVKDLCNEDQIYLNFLINSPNTENNYLVSLLKEYKKLRNNLVDLSWISKNSLKINGKKYSQNIEFDSANEYEQFVTNFTLFTNSKGLDKLSNENIYSTNKSLNFRIGYLALNIALSDKGRTVIQKLPLVKLESKNLNILGDNSINFSNETLNFLLDQTFLSELNRIAQTYSQTTNISSYDEVSKVFMTIPAFNSITVKIDNINFTIGEILENNNGILPESLKEIVYLKAKNIITEYFNSKVDEKLSKNGDKGLIVEGGLYKKDDKFENVNFISTDFINKSYGENKLQKTRTALMEFTVNTFLSNIFTTEVYLGGISFFGKKSMLPLINGKIDFVKLAQPKYYNNFTKLLAANLQKRAAMLIAPGLNYADSNNSESIYAQEFVHIALEDNKSDSNLMKNLVEEEYGKFNNETNEAWEKLQNLKKSLKVENSKSNINSILSKIKDIKNKYFSNISKYFDIEGTDAQEYVTWREHLQSLLRQGIINREQHNIFIKKILNQEELSQEELNIIYNVNIGQPEKDVYTGIIRDSILNITRPIYIKSSNFPLIPQVVKNTNLDKIRLLMEKVESENNGVLTENLDKSNEDIVVKFINGTYQYYKKNELGIYEVNYDIKKTVRASYQTANKIGEVSNPINLAKLYNGTLIENEIVNSLTKLPYKDLKLQQETPSKEKKYFLEEKDSKITMGGQPFKQLFGNFINNIESEDFDNIFSEYIKNISKINRNKINGKDLDKIATEIYREYQNLNVKILFKEIGLDKDKNFYELDLNTRNDIIKNLQKIITKTIDSGNYTENLKDSIGLILEEDEVKIESSLLFDNNRHKFESLLQSIVANRLINHKLPGNQHILGSSEGFDAISDFESLSKENKESIIWINGFKKELKSNYIKSEDGVELLIEAEVLIQSHWTYKDNEGNFKYVDLSEIYNEETGKGYSRYIRDEFDNIIGLELIENRIDKELLSMFSFRIPWSSHQSGTNIKVVGFLPNSMQDLLITSKDFLVQIGEDFDIDKRNVYKQNYYVDKETGNIKIINDVYIDNELNSFDNLTTNEIIDIIKYDSKELGKEWGKLFNLLQESKYKLDTLNLIKYDESLNKIFKLLLYDNDELTQNEIDNILLEIEQNTIEIGLNEDNQTRLIELKKEFYNGKRNGVSKKFKQNLKDALKLKLLENDLINTYKSVYSTSNNEVRKKIFKPLSTDFTKKTGSIIDNLSNTDYDDIYFSLYSDSFQNSLIINGADGKFGIAIHSNGVIFESQLQRLRDKIIIFDNTFFNGVINYTPFELILGENKDKITVDNILGKNKNTIDSLRDITDVHSENQNRATDNIKEQTMGKINENTETIGIYTLLAHLGIDATKIKVDYVENNILKTEYLNFSALLISQPIIKDYVKLSKKYNGQLTEFLFDNKKEKFIINKLENKYGIPPLEEKDYLTKEFNLITSQNLIDNLNIDNGVLNINLQRQVLITFLKLKKLKVQLDTYRQAVNFSNASIGMSYFDTINHIKLLDNIGDEHYDLLSKIGTSNNAYKLIGEISKEPLDSYVRLGKYYWLPNTLEGIMVVNALNTSDKLLSIFFPYDSPTINNIISTIFINKNLDINKKSKNNNELKYEIMSEFVKYINSNIGFFEGDLNSEKERLLIDSPVNTSLGSVLIFLKQIRHPVMNIDILKDLNISYKNGVNYIFNTPNEDILFNTLNKSEMFLQMLLDDTPLKYKGKEIIKNGEVISLSKIIQDLITYAYLTDDRKGAVGYKNIIPAIYLSKIGVFKNHRAIFEAIVNNKETFFIGDKEQNTNNFSSNFLVQYYQHNPNRAFIIDEKNFKNIRKEYKPYEIPQFISYRKNGKWVLYYYNSNLDKFINLPLYTDKNSYDSSKNSLILAEKSSNYENEVRKINETSNKYILPDSSYDIRNFSTAFKTKEKYSTVRNLLNTILDSKKTSNDFKNIITNILPYINDNVKLVWDTNHVNMISYNRQTNIITIKPEILEILLDKYNNDFNLSLHYFKEAIIEEVIHSITVNQIDKYLEFSNLETGEIKVKDDSPIHIWKIAKAYELARKAIPYNKENVESHLKTYFSKNIYEFVHGYFTNEQYREDIEKAEPGFKEKFFDAIVQMFKHLKSVLTGKYPDHKEEIFNSIRTLFKENKKEQSIKEQNNKQISFEDIGEKEFSRPLDNLSISITRNEQIDDWSVETSKSNIESRFNLKTNQLPNIHKCK